MKTQKIVVRGLLVFGAIAGAASGLRAQTAPDVRVIPAMPGVSLASRVVPGDRVIVLKRMEEVNYISESLPFSEELADLAETAQVLLLVNRLKAVPSETVDDGWIRTRVTVSIVETLKRKQIAPPITGKTIEFEHDGGEIKVGDVVIRAGDYPVWRPGGKYLLSLRYDGAAKIWRLGFWAPIDSTGRFVSREYSTGRKFRSSLDGTTVQSVLSELRRHLR